jgi:hypothetical protein
VSSTFFNLLFAVLMAGAIVVMLAILVGLVTDGATWGRDSRVWLAKLQSLYPVAVNQSTRRFNS